MLYLLFTHMEQATEANVQQMLPLVSAQRREQALRYSHTFGRFCCLKSYCMLQELLASVSPTLDGTTPEFSYNEHGKPSLKNRPDIHFSISHTKNAILVAISDKPIGVDVEQRRTPSAALVERVMAPEEREGDFTMLWVQKEAVLKLRGTGITGDLQSVLPEAARDGIAVEAVDGGEFCWAVGTPSDSPLRGREV